MAESRAMAATVVASSVVAREAFAVAASLAAGLEAVARVERPEAYEAVACRVGRQVGVAAAGAQATMVVAMAGVLDSAVAPD